MTLKLMANPAKPILVEINALRHFFVLQRTQWLSSEDLRKIQQRNLRLLLEHAYTKVPYYRQILRERNLKPEDFRASHDLAKLPVLTKDKIKQHFSEFLARNSLSYWPIATATGGSTGDPLKFFIDARCAGVGEAALWRGWSYAGYRFGDRMATLAGLSLVSSKENLLKAAAKRVLRRISGFPAISLDRVVLDSYAKQIAAYRPKFIRGYPSSIHYFADFLKEKGIRGINLHAVLTTAEMLFPHQRKLIQEVFQCDVFDGYGAFDGGTAAFECEEHEGYHMAVEKAVFEFVDDDGNPVTEGESGRIIATDLFNYSMPFIRYDTGDIGAPSNDECPCGRKLPLMKQILGRTTDILKFANGRALSGPSLTLVFKDFDIKQYQVEQTDDNSIIVRIVAGKTFGEKDVKKIYRVLKDATGDGVDVTIDLVDYVQTTKGGKWNIVIAHARRE